MFYTFSVNSVETGAKQLTILNLEIKGPKRVVRVRWGVDLEKCGIVRAELTVKPVQEEVKLFGGGAPWVGVWLQRN